MPNQGMAKAVLKHLSRWFQHFNLPMGQLRQADIKVAFTVNFKNSLLSN